ncbi:MAG: hypothetical protein ACOXZ6_06395 [Syntrophomonadaceae bacterium]|jgi:hypothetical protein|nr:hypothetical protein [Bacillota bacterium]NLP24875.1 hypothetical protein [Syntrophomonadaceae bacterium]
MLQERDVFKEIMRLLGLAFLVYGLLTFLQSATALLYTPLQNHFPWLQLIQPLVYALTGLIFLKCPVSIAYFAYPREQSVDWSHKNILKMGIKLAGIWLILTHLGTFLRHLNYYLEQVPILGHYQVLTHSLWPAVAIYIVIIIIGMVMLRYQPRETGEEYRTISLFQK